MGTIRRLIIFLAGAAVGLAAAVFFIREIRSPEVVRHVFRDTVRVPAPVARDSAVIRYRRVTLPTAPSDGRPAENIPMFEDLESIGKGKPSLPPPDSADVEIPITQTVYRDSDYTAYVSGYAARLDSLTLTRRREVLTATREVPPPGRRKRWGIGIQAGAGLSPSGRPGFAPYVGIGVSYNLFTF